MTENGTQCLKWTSTSPHHIWATPERFPDAGLGPHNFCRNPDGVPKPWCYTVDKSIRFEFCDVGEPKDSCSGGE